MNVTAIRAHLRASALLLTLAGIATPADQPAVRAILKPANERKVISGIRFPATRQRERRRAP